MITHFRRRHALSASRPFVEIGLPLARYAVLVASAFLLAGCAYNRPMFSEQTISTNGVVTTRTLSVRTFAIWPATTQLDKQRASLGKTMSLGTTGLSEDGGSTNISAVIESLTKLIQNLK